MKLKCDLCNKNWRDKNISKTDGPWQTFQDILESHRKISPKCEGNRYTIKIMEV